MECHAIKCDRQAEYHAVSGGFDSYYCYYHVPQCEWVEAERLVAGWCGERAPNVGKMTT